MEKTLTQTVVQFCIELFCFVFKEFFSIFSIFTISGTGYFSYINLLRTVAYGWYFAVSLYILIFFNFSLYVFFLSLVCFPGFSVFSPANGQSLSIPLPLLLQIFASGFALLLLS